MDYYQRLKELRNDNDITQKQLAFLLNTDQQQYSRWETGKRELPILNLKKLCKFYNVSADYILGLPEGMPYPKR